MNTGSQDAGSSERDQLRREMRRRRRALPGAVRSAAAAQFARIAERALLLRPGRHVAVYFAHGHEADLSALIATARARGCHLYLPAITAQHRPRSPRASGPLDGQRVDAAAGRMVFRHYAAHCPLRANRYGIAEPASTAPRIRALELDLIFVPLLAVDPSGWRLGSGAGYYDRCLKHLHSARLWRRPKLIGVAYELQRVPRLEPAPWDVPLDALITELDLYPARRPPGAAPITTRGVP